AAVRFHRIPRKRRQRARRSERLTVVRSSAEQVESRPFRFHCDEAETAAQDEAQVEVLEWVIVVIIEDIPDHASGKISVVSPPAAHGSSSRCGNSVDRGRSADRVELNRRLVRIRNSGGSKGAGKGGRFRV